MASVAERVQAGIELLDAEGPDGWRDKIDLDDLDMRSEARCVLGQAYGRGWFGSPTAKHELSEVGFNAEYFDEPPITFDVLQAEWIRRLTEV